MCRALAKSYPGDAVLAVLLQGGGEHPFVEAARQVGARVEVIVGGRRRYDREVALLAALLERERPDVVHTHIYHSDFVGFAAARRLGIPVVAHVHGITGGDWKDRLYQWLDLRLLRRFDALICVSESVRERVIAEGCAAARTHVIENPYVPTPALPRADARAALGLDADRPIIGWIGRLSIEKGADLLLRSIARLGDRRPYVVLVGDGPERAALTAAVDRLGLQDRVRFAGEMKGAASFLEAFDALVISSRSEGLPMTLLEAMGAGTPVVSFRVGGIPDAIDDDCAWLAPALDTDGLAAAIANALADGRAARAKADVARQRVNARYGIDRWIDAIVEVHARVIAARA